MSSRGGNRSRASKRRTALSDILRHLREIPFDSGAASQAAYIRLDLERRGLTIGPLDLVIAGTALSRDAILVTSNRNEFRRIAGLRLEDWNQ